ncbi:hypothetical protein LX36DRAFT_659784 [Colletotrichum falcatum]|nr:hypothetical protein LX36DRAFT_659784 [Colletotrichum falcatum]
MTTYPSKRNLVLLVCEVLGAERCGARFVADPGGRQAARNRGERCVPSRGHVAVRMKWCSSHTHARPMKTLVVNGSQPTEDLQLTCHLLSVRNGSYHYPSQRLRKTCRLAKQACQLVHAGAVL